MQLPGWGRGATGGLLCLALGTHSAPIPVPVPASVNGWVAGWPPPPPPPAAFTTAPATPPQPLLRSQRPPRQLQLSRHLLQAVPLQQSQPLLQPQDQPRPQEEMLQQLQLHQPPPAGLQPLAAELQPVLAGPLQPGPPQQPPPAVQTEQLQEPQQLLIQPQQLERHTLQAPDKMWEGLDQWQEGPGGQVLDEQARLAAQPPMPLPTSSGMLAMRSLRIANAGPGGSRLYLGRGSEISLGTDEAAAFTIQGASEKTPFLALDAGSLRLGSQRVEALAVDAEGGLRLRGVAQWQLARAEDFAERGAGWSREEVSQCAGVFMLGGYCRFSRGEANKTFAGLPPHKQLRVVATYHFIDRWIGETGYMKLNVGQNGCPVVVWSEQHSQGMSRNGISLCGQSHTPEGKFAAAIDVTVPHHQDSVQLTFGSTMDDCDPCDESWGVSSVEIYTRS